MPIGSLKPREIPESHWIVRRMLLSETNMFEGKRRWQTVLKASLLNHGLCSNLSSKNYDQLAGYGQECQKPVTYFSQLQKAIEDTVETLNNLEGVELDSLFYYTAASVLFNSNKSVRFFNMPPKAHHGWLTRCWNSRFVGDIYVGYIICFLFVLRNVCTVQCTVCKLCIILYGDCNHYHDCMLILHVGLHD